MRAVTVRVNDVVGVAGFVMPGMRVDVLVTGRPNNSDGTITNTVLQNIYVLTAGTVIQPDARGQAINAPNVTLLVTPEQAEIMTLAANEGRIQLVLRNGADMNVEKTPGRSIAQLFGGREPQRPQQEQAPRRPRPVATVAATPVPTAPPPPPPPPTTSEVIVIRGATKAVETVNIIKSN
jgi:pilus assembly protein CpaB